MPFLIHDYRMLAERAFYNIREQRAKVILVLPWRLPLKLFT